MTTIWQIKDGKRGHENQSSGLIRALSKLLPLQSIEINVDEQRSTWFEYIIGRCDRFHAWQKPDLIIGAGSRTHSTLLAAGRATKAPTILLMAPPRGLTRLFDLCIVPEHDARSGSNIIITKGALNRLQPHTDKKDRTGLFLIGGPSKHHRWDESNLVIQIEKILRYDPVTEWTLTTSRRTPASTTARLLEQKHPRCEVVPAEKTDGSWLPAHLATAPQVWVSEDSVSMIYEALSVGAKVGVLPVPRKARNSRVIRGVDQLIEDGQVLPYQSDQVHSKLSAFDAPPPLDEAGRIAGIIVNSFSLLI